MSELTQKHCIPCEGGRSPLEKAKVEELLQQVPDWTYDPALNIITRVFHFKNFYQTMAFVNAVAWIAHQENHHPDLQVSYDSCLVQFTTHAVSGLTKNDFICAAKIDALMESYGLS